jgi:hypothetical protein
LFAVRERFGGIGVNLHEQTIRTCGNRSARGSWDKVNAACGMTWIGDDRKMRGRFDLCDGASIVLSSGTINGLMVDAGASTP